MWKRKHNLNTLKKKKKDKTKLKETSSNTYLNNGPVKKKEERLKKEKQILDREVHQKNSTNQSSKVIFFP